jgi:phage baseplate assembly protein W
VPTRISRGFKDISLSFRRHPITNDLLVLKDETAIAKSIRNIAATALGEKFFKPNFGSVIARSTFDVVDPRIVASYEGSIKDAIQKNEPRVDVTNIRAVAAFEANAIDFIIEYKIIGLDVGLQNLSFIAKSVR